MFPNNPIFKCRARHFSHSLTLSLLPHFCSLLLQNKFESLLFSAFFSFSTTIHSLFFHFLCSNLKVETPLNPTQLKSLTHSLCLFLLLPFATYQLNFKHEVAKLFPFFFFMFLIIINLHCFWCSYVQFKRRCCRMPCWHFPQNSLLWQLPHIPFWSYHRRRRTSSQFCGVLQGSGFQVHGENWGENRERCHSKPSGKADGVGVNSRCQLGKRPVNH